VTVRWNDTGVIYPAMVDPIWTNAAELAFEHSRHSATRLDDGRVLVAGGVTAGLAPSADAEVFDPGSGTWAMVDPLPASRTNHSATLITAVSALQNQVLVVGGVVDGTTSSSCIAFDPSLGTWSPAAALGQARASHAAAVTGSKLLVAGGTAGGAFNALASADLFDPVMPSTWTTVGSLATPRVGSSAHSLDAADGVLIAGGVYALEQTTASAEIFDPNGPTGPGFGGAGTMSVGRAYFPLVRLQDGQLLAAGGMNSYDFAVTNVQATATTDRYDPTMGTWTPGPPMSVDRYRFTTTLLENGSLLATGGLTGGTSLTQMVLDSPELLDPGFISWLPTDPMLQVRAFHSASRLDDGTVLVVGGETLTAALKSVQRYGGLPAGEDCTRATECTSGNCAAGICCDAPCDGVCESCEAAIKGSGDDGVCGPIAAGTDPRDECLDDGSPSCQQNGQCDGAGACQQYPSSNGCTPEPCGSSDECASGSCVDGICCDGECDGECESCLGAATSNVDGQCAPIVKGTDPDDDCSDGSSGDCSSIFLCDGTGSCVAAEEVCDPYSCLDASGCNTSCTDDAGCAATHRCDDGVCVVRAAGCDGTVLVGADGSTDDCSPYTCDPSGPACKESCESAADCAPGFVCSGDGSCVANPTAPESDDGCGCRLPGRGSRDEDSRRSWLLLAALAAVARPRRRRPPV